MPVVRIADVKPQSGGDYPYPFDGKCGSYTAWHLGNAGDLSQFGVLIEKLDPGSQSALRHWHEQEDEFVYMLEGEVVLVEDDGEQVLKPGDAATFKAGIANGHHLVNRSGEPAKYLVVGTRAALERCHYPDDDLLYARNGQTKSYTRKDSSPLPSR